MRRLRGTHARAALHVQRACRGFVGRKRAATLRKTAFLDIWRAAREGTIASVLLKLRGTLWRQPTDSI